MVDRGKPDGPSNSTSHRAKSMLTQETKCVCPTTISPMNPPSTQPEMSTMTDPDYYPSDELSMKDVNDYEMENFNTTKQIYH